MTNPFAEFIALNQSIEKQALVNRLEQVLARKTCSSAALAERSGVPLRQIHAMLSLDTRQVSLAEIEKVLAAACGR